MSDCEFEAELWRILPNACDALDRLVAGERLERADAPAGEAERAPQAGEQDVAHQR